MQAGAGSCGRGAKEYGVEVPPWKEYTTLRCPKKVESKCRKAREFSVGKADASPGSGEQGIEGALELLERGRGDG